MSGERAVQSTWRARYDALAADDPRREALLAELVRARDATALGELADALVSDPPTSAERVARVCAALFQGPSEDIRAMFPRLLDGLAHPATAAVTLDLANFLAERRVIWPHAAADRRAELGRLLRALVEGLTRLEEQPPTTAAELDVVRQRVQDASAVFVGLCRALALVGDVTQTPALFGALGVSHRRLRAEAAAALGALGEAAGVEALVELAAVPVARSRALAYLEELGMLERAAASDREPNARAAGELAAWLAEPINYGLAPGELALWDERRLFWPGFEEPVACFLFRYDYCLPGGELSGVGLVGPRLQCLAGEWGDMTADDLYALFAGRQVEHEQIAVVETGLAAANQEQNVERLGLLLDAWDEPHGPAELVLVGEFFGDEVLVAWVDRAGEPGFAAADGQQVGWLAAREGVRSLGADDCWQWYVGRRLLAHFNPPDTERTAPDDA